MNKFLFSLVGLAVITGCSSSDNNDEPSIKFASSLLTDTSTVSDPFTAKPIDINNLEIVGTELTQSDLQNLVDNGTLSPK